MRRKKTEQIDSVLSEFLRLNLLQTPLLEHRLVASWPEIAGETIAAQSHATHISHQKLYVTVSSAPLRGNLLAMRQQLVQQLNTHVGAHIITDIVFQ